MEAHCELLGDTGEGVINKPEIIEEVAEKKV